MSHNSSMTVREILQPKDIVFLQDETALYACDFRAVGGTSGQAVPSLWSYENLLPWILENKFVTANELSSTLKYDSPNRILALERGEDSRISIFEKIPSDFISKNNIKSLWVAVAHPQADLLAQRHNLRLNFNYNSLISFNNKLSQKKLWGEATPRWREISSPSDILEIRRNGERGLIKNSFGVSGNKIFNIDESGKDFDELFLKTPSGWFFEEYIEGVPHSIQCVSYPGRAPTIVFGFTRQLIAEGKRFVGSQILELDDLDSGLWRQLESAVKNLGPLMGGYEGFWGLDFIIQPSGQIYVLEANVRMTAATVPVLLALKRGWTRPQYLEDVSSNSALGDDVILTQDSFSGTVDVLRKAN